MYKALLKVEDMVGKTVKGAKYLRYMGQIMIAFTDETYIHVEAFEDYDTPSLRVLRENEIFMFGDKNTAKLGVSTLQELEDMREERRRASEEERQSNERATYERLKVKFES